MAELDNKRHLRHCMVVYAAYPHYETRVQREAEALVAHGFEVDVICPALGDDKAEDEHLGVHIHRVKQKWARRKNLLGQFSQYITFFIFASVKLAKLNARHHYDIVQAHNLPDFLAFVGLIPKLTGSRVILDLHDLMPEFYQGKFGKGGKNILRRLILLQERLSCRFADHVITVTEHWRQTLIKRGVPSEKCSVVMNLADTRIFQPLGPRNKSGREAGKFCLFYHGDMPERYGLDLVLRAMHQLRTEIPAIHFKLVGGGQYLGELKKLADELDLSRCHVEFIPGVPVEKLPSLIATADVAVVPYRNDVFTDSLLPTKLMEYAILGLPAIVGRTTAIATYFDESMVQFFEPDNVNDLARCILLLYKDIQRREQLAQGIQQFHERHNWAELSEQYVSLVETLACGWRK